MKSSTNTSSSFILLLTIVFLVISSVHSANINIPKDDAPKYEVVLMNEDDFDEPELGSTMVEMTNVEGENFNCYIPPSPVQRGTSNTVAPTNEAIVSALELLEGVCLYRMTGWWTYELCHGRFVNQFHLEKELRVAENNLGQLLDVSYLQKLGVLKNFKAGQADGSKPYFSVLYEDGSICDLTGAPRTAEVRYFCEPRVANSINDFSEPSSCNYLFIVHTPYLCKLNAFKPKQESVLDIICVQKTYAKWKTDLKALEAALAREI